MLGTLSVAKLIPWAVLFLLPSKHDIAKKELHSNMEVIGLCITLA
jgi:hypothetical protein